MSHEESESGWRAISDRLRRLPRNPISMAGIAMALVALANILFLFLIDLISEKTSPYIGILGFMIMPAFLIAGLLLILVGYWREKRKKASGLEEVSLYPKIDLNDPNQRSTAVFFLSFLGVFVMMSAIGSYKAYEFTD